MKFFPPLAMLSIFVVSCGSPQSSNFLPSQQPTSTGTLSALSATLVSEKKLFSIQNPVWSSGPQITYDESTRNAFQATVIPSLEGATLEITEVKPWMSVHGHGVPPGFRPTWRLDGNIVRVDRMGFTMAGPWEVIVRIAVNGVVDQVQIPVEIRE